MPVGTSMSRGKRRALKNYIPDKGEASLIWDKIRESLGRVVTFLGRLRLGGLRHQAFLHRCRKVHHFHLFLPT